MSGAHLAVAAPRARGRDTWSVSVAVVRSELLVLGIDVVVAQLEHRFLDAVLPSPGIAKPELRKNVERRLRSAIVDGHAHQHVFDVGLCVFDEHIEVAIVVEYARVQELVLGCADSATAVLFQKIGVRIGRMRILVEHLQIRVRRRRVEVVVEFLHILAMVAFAVRQAEQAFLQDRVVPVPECERETQALFAIAEACDAVFAPPIRTAACVIMREVVPGVAVGAVVLAHGAPLALAQIRAPLLPCRLERHGHTETTLLGVERLTF